MRTKNVIVLSHALPGTGGFEWLPDTKANRPIMERGYLDEIKCWGDMPAKVRLLKVKVPRGLTREEITEWLDDNIDGLEYEWPAMREYGRNAYDEAMRGELA